MASTAVADAGERRPAGAAPGGDRLRRPAPPSPMTSAVSSRWAVEMPATARSRATRSKVSPTGDLARGGRRGRRGRTPARSRNGWRRSPATGRPLGLGDAHDVGSRDQSPQRGELAGRAPAPCRGRELGGAFVDRGAGLRVEHPRQGRRAPRRRRRGSARRSVRCPPVRSRLRMNQTMRSDEQVLDLGVETELVLAGYRAVEPVDGEVQLHQAVGVAGHRVGLGDGGGIRPGLVDEARDQGRAAAVDDDVGERGRDDLPAQAVALHGVGEPALATRRGSSAAIRGRNRGRRGPGSRAARRRARAWRRRAPRRIPAGSGPRPCAGAR